MRRFPLGIILVALPVASARMFDSFFGKTSISAPDTVKRSVADWDPPAFCHGLECPRYDTLYVYPTYEIRRYEETLWVTTKVTGVNYDDAQNVGFHRLFDYISGSNDGQTKIPMTVPVVTQVTPGPGPTCGTDFTVSFYVPPDFQANPPKPLSPDVSVVTVPSRLVFVTSFPGWSTEKTVLQNAQAFGSNLSASSQSFHKDYFFSAGYDSPFKLFNRHNEVMFEADPPAWETGKEFVVDAVETVVSSVTGGVANLREQLGI